MTDLLHILPLIQPLTAGETSMCLPHIAGIACELRDDLTESEPKTNHIAFIYFIQLFSLSSGTGEILHTCFRYVFSVQLTKNALQLKIIFDFVYIFNFFILNLPADPSRYSHSLFPGKELIWETVGVLEFNLCLLTNMYVHMCMQEERNGPRPRLCHLKKGASGYGFNLHSEKSKLGQFIRAVDEDSPAQRAGLRPQDKIVQVHHTRPLSHIGVLIVCRYLPTSLLPYL